MHLREHEHVVKKIRRHLTPYVLSLIKLGIASLPFYVIASFLGKSISTKFIVISYLVISAFVGFFVVYITITYLLDHLVVTNERIIFVNWRSFFRRDESEMDLKDIQDIRTHEKGILSKLRIFDYGTVEVETASSSTTIVFKDAPDPESIREYIYSRRRV